MVTCFIGAADRHEVKFIKTLAVRNSLLRASFWCEPLSEHTKKAPDIKSRGAFRFWLLPPEKLISQTLLGLRGLLGYRACGGF